MLALLIHSYHFSNPINLLNRFAFLTYLFHSYLVLAVLMYHLNYYRSTFPLPYDLVLLRVLLFPVNRLFICLSIHNFCRPELIKVVNYFIQLFQIVFFFIFMFFIDRIVLMDIIATCGPFEIVLPNPLLINRFKEESQYSILFSHRKSWLIKPNVANGPTHKDFYGVDLLRILTIFLCRIPWNPFQSFHKHSRGQHYHMFVLLCVSIFIKIEFMVQKTHVLGFVVTNVCFGKIGSRIPDHQMVDWDFEWVKKDLVWDILLFNVVMGA